LVLQRRKKHRIFLPAPSQSSTLYFPQKALHLREVNLDFYLLDGILEDGLHGLLVHLPLFPDLEELRLKVA